MTQPSAWLETLGQDLRLAVRSLKKSPGFLAVAILSLALGIGANSTIFSVIDNLLYRPLPYDHPEQLTAIWQTQLNQPGSGGQPPPIAESLDWKKQNHVFQDIALTSMNEEGVLAGTGAPSASSYRMSRQIFSVCWASSPSWAEFRFRPRCRITIRRW